jgi:hypothetical protein
MCESLTDAALNNLDLSANKWSQPVVITALLKHGAF